MMPPKSHYRFFKNTRGKPEKTSQSGMPEKKKLYVKSSKRGRIEGAVPTFEWGAQGSGPEDGGVTRSENEHPEGSAKKEERLSSI